MDKSSTDELMAISHVTPPSRAYAWRPRSYVSRHCSQSQVLFRESGTFVSRQVHLARTVVVVSACEADVK